MIRAILLRGGLFALLWWVLTEGRAEAWGVGLVSVVLAVAASLKLSPPGSEGISWAGLLSFLGFFFIQSLRGGAQVAALALRPRLVLAPAWITVPLTVPPGRPTLLLAGALSLMPGTLSVRIEDRSLKLHVLDARLPVAEEVRTMEVRIARMYGVRP